MEPPHNTLGSILADLVGSEAERAAYRANPDGFLAERGYPELPDRAVGEAVCHVAESLPAPVAEQLAPEVMALSPLTTGEWVEADAGGGADALGALAAVPVPDFGEHGVGVADDVDLDLDPAASPDTDPPGPGDGAESGESDGDEPDPQALDQTGASDPGFGSGTTVEIDQAGGFDELGGFDEFDDFSSDLGGIDAASATSIAETPAEIADETEDATTSVSNADPEEPAELDGDWDLDID